MSDTSTTDWQDKQNAILDGIEERINALPKRIANDLRYGLYRECRSLVETLNMSKSYGSAHDVVERMIGELVAELELIHAIAADRLAPGDTVQSPAATPDPVHDMTVRLAVELVEHTRAIHEALGMPEDADTEDVTGRIRALLGTDTTPEAGRG